MGPGGGVIVMTQQPLNFTFYPPEGPNENYTGHVRKVGADIGVTGSTVITWAVLDEQANSNPEGLAGTYAGISADAALGLGMGVNVLLGGSDRSFILTPISAQGELGLDVALGITEIELVRS